MIKFSAKFVTTGKIRSKICSVFCKEIWCAIQQYDNRIIFKPKEREESGSDQFPPFNSTVDCRLTSSHSRGRGRWLSLVLSSEEERSEVDSRHCLRELCSWECYESHSFVVGAIQCGYIVCLILFSYAEWRLYRKEFISKESILSTGSVTLQWNSRELYFAFMRGVLKGYVMMRMILWIRRHVVPLNYFLWEVQCFFCSL